MADHVHESWWLIESTVAPRALYYAGHKKPGRTRAHMSFTDDAAKAARFPDEWGAKYALATMMGLDTGKFVWPLDRKLSHLVVREHIFDYTPRVDAGVQPPFPASYIDVGEVELGEQIGVGIRERVAILNHRAVDMPEGTKLYAKAPDGVRAIERHGDAAILDRAFTGFTALPPPIVAGMKRPWREVMEFPPLAVVSAEMVTARYRKLAMERHSDRPGGSDAKMAELNAARDEALSEVAP